MALSLAESQAVNDLARCIYDFLPGKAHPYADQTISFEGAAHISGLGSFWRGGSKLPSIVLLLEQTLSMRRDLFCALLLEIVRKALIYRTNKGDPLTRQGIVEINELIRKVGFKIPELWDPAFLDALPKSKDSQDEKREDKPLYDVARLRQEFLRVSKLEPQERGYVFENFLQQLFSMYSLAPRKSFRVVGEQIDGSCQFDNETYLIEAKWHEKLTRAADLYVFREKVGGKSQWSRGIFISQSGFSEDSLVAFATGRATNIIGLSGQDLFFILEGQMTLLDALRSKVRRAAEDGSFYVPVFSLVRGQ